METQFDFNDHWLQVKVVARTLISAVFFYSKCFRFGILSSNREVLKMWWPFPIATFYSPHICTGWSRVDFFHEPGEPTGASEVWSVWTLSPACWHLSRCMRRGDQDLPRKSVGETSRLQQLLGWDNMIGCQMTHELCVSINCINVYYIYLYICHYIYIHTCHMSLDIYIYTYIYMSLLQQRL